MLKKSSSPVSFEINPNLESLDLGVDLTQHALEAAPTLASNLDLTAFRLPQNFNAVGGVKKLITSVPGRKPGTQTYFRVRPGDDWRMEALILQLKEDGESYFVMPQLACELASECRPKMLYTYVDRDGNLGIWPINLPGEDGRLDAWSQSAHTAAAHAEERWVRLLANRHVGAYDVIEATNLAEEPQWPDLDFKKVLSLAFKERLITSMSHPIVRRLRGEI